MNLKARALLFDLDGTLVDSEPLKAQGISEALAHFGYSVDKNVYKKVMGQSWESVLKEFFKHTGNSIPEDQFNPIFRSRYKSLIENKLSPNAELRKWLIKLKSKNIQLALVSSAARWMVDGILKQIHLDDILDITISGDDVQKHKPDPEAYLLALEKLNLPAADAVIFEDSEAGLAAAKNAGVACISIRHDYNQTHDFSESILELKTLSDAFNLNF